MTLIIPFRGIYPAQETASQVVCLPQRTPTLDQVGTYFLNHPLSFLKVIHSDLELSLELNVEQSALSKDLVCDRAKIAYQKLWNKGVFKEDSGSGFYIHELRSKTHSQTGLVVYMPLSEYISGKVRGHENTFSTQVNFRKSLLSSVKIFPAPVCLTFRNNQDLMTLLKHEKKELPILEVTTEDEVTHKIWRAKSSEAIQRTCHTIPITYIADGHHRVEATLALANETKSVNSFLATLFSEEELLILPYHRLLVNLCNQKPEQIISRLKETYEVVPGDGSPPKAKGHLTIYLANKWYALHPKSNYNISKNIMESLEVSMLEKHILSPIFGIDSNNSEYLEFIPGTHSKEVLEKIADSTKETCLFCLYPTTMKEVMDVADQKLIMAPKATWFEPKLPAGLVMGSI